MVSGGWVDVLCSERVGDAVWPRESIPACLVVWQAAAKKPIARVINIENSFIKAHQFSTCLSRLPQKGAPDTKGVMLKLW